MSRTKKIKKTRAELLKEFYDSPAEALFSTNVIAAVLDWSPNTVIANRYVKKTIPFIKIDKAIRYRKQDIINFLNNFSIE